ncbi:hypothetical protein PENSPDRAFT_510027 [Peniophora sp. CONT]|nr:hypothetical protein PENSPDRAFT_510027 [Peniophora sp. CONT]
MESPHVLRPLALLPLLVLPSLLSEAKRSSRPTMSRPASILRLCLSSPSRLHADGWTNLSNAWAPHLTRLPRFPRLGPLRMMQALSLAMPFRPQSYRCGWPRLRTILFHQHPPPNPLCRHLHSLLHSTALRRTFRLLLPATPLSRQSPTTPPPMRMLHPS